MDLYQTIFYIGVSLILYFTMRGVDFLFMKKKMFYKPSTRWHTLAASIFVAVVYALVVLIVVLYRGTVYTISPVGMIAFYSGEAVAMIAMGWAISLPFRYAFKQRKKAR